MGKPKVPTSPIRFVTAPKSLRQPKEAIRPPALGGLLVVVARRDDLEEPHLSHGNLTHYVLVAEVGKAAEARSCHECLLAGEQPNLNS